MRPPPGKRGDLMLPATSTARTFLTLELAGRTGHLVALLGFMGTLALIGKILLHVQVDSVVISLHAENSVRKDHFTACLFSLCV